MKTLRTRCWMLGTLAALAVVGTSACDSPSAPPIEEEPKEDDEPKDGIRSRTSLYSFAHSAAA